MIEIKIIITIICYLKTKFRKEFTQIKKLSGCKAGMCLLLDTKICESTCFYFSKRYRSTLRVFINPIQDGGRGVKVRPTSFSPLTSTNVEISPQNFLNFGFNPFVN